MTILRMRPTVLACWTAAILTCLGATLPAQQRGRRPPPRASGGVLRADQACFDVRHYTLRVAVDPAEQTIEGTLVMRADATAAVPTLALDLDELLTVRSVNLDGEPVAFEHRDRRIHITPKAPVEQGASFVVEVGYGGAPLVARNPPWSGGFTWKKTPAGAPWIATSCQGEGADVWWPCKDHPSDKPDGFDLYCTVPEGLVVASNGVEAAEPVTAAGRTTFHWRTTSPIANYNIALNIAPYVELQNRFECIDGTEMPIRFFVLPSSKARAQRCMRQFLDHLRVFEQLLGPYPFRHEKYGIAETPHLGMEHQTIIGYGNGFRDEQWDWLHNHELAHEWWGNLVSCGDWKDMWLHEGFGTYMQPLYREVRFGPQAYFDEIHKHRTMNRRPLAPREPQTSREIYFGGGSNDIYYKGSLVLHTLRFHLGDPRFAQLLRRFCYPDEVARAATDGSQCRTVDTDEFVALCNSIAGEDLGWFFEVYVRSAGLPRLSYRVDASTLKLRWQTPGDLPFSLRVPVRLGGTVHDVTMADGHGEIFVGKAAWKIDPDERLLMAPPAREQ